MTSQEYAHTFHDLCSQEWAKAKVRGHHRFTPTCCASISQWSAMLGSASGPRNADPTNCLQGSSAYDILAPHRGAPTGQCPARRASTSLVRAQAKTWQTSASADRAVRDMHRCRRLSTWGLGCSLCSTRSKTLTKVTSKLMLPRTTIVPQCRRGNRPRFSDTKSHQHQTLERRVWSLLFSATGSLVVRRRLSPTYQRRCRSITFTHTPSPTRARFR